MKNIFEIVQEVLLGADKYQSEDNNLLKAKVYSDIMMMDEELLSLLLSNERIKEEFFTKVKNTLIFDKQKFAWLIESKEFLPDSYTRYSNKIGLTSNGNFISQKNDVVLDFPYKDCYLQGGQDKEDQKREEIFYHETIANDEVTRMLAPKVFTNAKRYTKGGIEENIEMKDDDNLIIKGNNLIGLSSILKRYEGKVKCIFIDPPYFFNKTKPSDTFSYNSNFKLSSWLVFMKNRLEVAHKMLSEEGVLFMAISDEGAHYLKVITDDIFDMENFIADVTWESRKSVSSDGLFSQNSNHILVFAKNKNRIDKNSFRLSLDIESFKYDDKDGRGKYRLEPFDAPNIRKNLSYKIINPNTGEEYYPPVGRCWRTEEKTYLDLLKDGRIRFGVNGTAKPQLKTYYLEAKESGKGKASSTIWHDVTQSIIWQELDANTNATKDQMELFGETVFTNPKPEDLILRAIELSTTKNDWVMDFFMGSGTTQAVALKAGRRFIGLEQMDYINTVSIPRLQKVIEGEQTGVSKNLNWQGGGSFVYCELLENSKELIDEIQNATDATITDIKEKIYRDERIVPYITRDELEAIDVEFEKLTLEEKKMALCALVDKNKLYVNLSDIDDKAYNISDKDRKFTESFYKREV
ncbi:site-specific DNA-methyltransferase [Clostridium sp. cel8]|uniref:DNA methyltransferase n=1 Tax=Clostridium sp. cel8 TaxID=2663123 RepID=UPI0015F640BE|nr:site-specific DNA-methyltransferase [Clostridium sp. cel8]MBA5849709.1 site-specific DNA-methyltransferase [Clostridium sp. cel8]